MQKVEAQDISGVKSVKKATHFSHLVINNVIIKYLSDNKEFNDNKIKKLTTYCELPIIKKYNKRVDLYLKLQKQHKANIKLNIYDDLVKSLLIKKEEIHPKDIVETFLKNENKELLSQTKSINEILKFENINELEKSKKLDFSRLPHSGEVFVVHEKNIKSFELAHDKHKSIETLIENSTITSIKYNNLEEIKDYILNHSKLNGLEILQNEDLKVYCDHRIFENPDILSAFDILNLEKTYKIINTEHTSTKTNHLLEVQNCKIQKFKEDSYKIKSQAWQGLDNILINSSNRESFNQKISE